MPKPYRIGILGLSHDHVWDNLPHFREADDARLVAAADPNQPLLGRVEQEYRCRPYSNYETMLDSEELDAVCVYTDNATSVELAEMAVARRLHVLVEKPMAASLQGAERMFAAAEEAGVELMINWPFAWWPQMQHAIRMAAEGEIGQVWQVRYRAAHAGPQELGCSPYFCDWLFDPARNGPGGAFMDYCCYGAVLARVVMGMPTSVSAIGGRFVKQDLPVDDNAILVMKYGQGIAVSEASWTQIGKLTAYLTVIYGTSGTLMVEPRVGGRLLRASEEAPQGIDVAVPDPAPENRNSAVHFLHLIETGQRAIGLCDPQHCRDTQEILEAGVRSLSSGAHEALPLS